MKKVILSIEGMTCSACANGLEKYLNKQDKINKASVNLVMSTASVECDDDVTLELLSEYVSDIGFKCLGYASLNQEKRVSKIPFIIYGILCLLLMYISMSHILNLPVILFLHMENYPINYSLCLLILTIPFIYYGLDILKSGIKNLIHGMPNMDTLVSIGVISSLLYSIYGVIMVLLGNTMYAENLYFESVAFVIYFIKLGRFIETSTHGKTKDAIKELVEVTPKFAKIKTKKGIKEVTIDEVKKGDILICLAGDKFAVDGIIIEGTTHTDESFITGESKPVKKGINDKVIAGSINYDGVVLYQAIKVGKESTISEIVNLVVEATNTKAPISKLADKICSYFVPIIFIISIFTFVISWFFTNSLDVSLTRFVSVLVVACPCALGLATPLAIVTSIGVSAKSGILVKSSEIFETMNDIDTVVFDKTGTLTEGNLSVCGFYNFSKITDDELLYIIGSMEANSTHPIAKGIINYLNYGNIEYDKDIKPKVLVGKGIKCKIDNSIYYAGNNKLIKYLKIKNKYLKYENILTKEGSSVVYVVKDKKILGIFGVKDSIRFDARYVIDKLKKQNKLIVMLTGDNINVANYVNESLGKMTVIPQASPKDKALIIKVFKEEGKKVMFIGDGINDAPALVNSDISVSLSSGTDIAANSSSVILMNNKLSSILDLINISKNTLDNIKENLFWAFIYNICMIPIAAGLFSSFGLTLNPMMASFSMILSSLFVSINALRLKKIKIKSIKRF